jgi:transcriptional regulator with XRE-family HTH domain
MSMDDEPRRRELADFLRRCRARVTPEQVGLSPGSRRRTPGLRREEVAQLAGVGVTWYTWLEQGRDIHVSDQVLDAVARTFQLDPDERAHLFTLAGAAAAQVKRDCDAVDESILLLLQRFGTYPAAVLNGRFDILAFNRAFARVIGDLDELPFDERNTLWLAFTNPSFRSRLADWEGTARRCVAQYRHRMADHVGEPAWRTFVRRLQAASPEFDAIWREHDIAGNATVTKQFFHAELGLIQCRANSLWLNEGHNNRLVAYTPADDVSAQRLEALADHPIPRLAAFSAA